LNQEQEVGDIERSGTCATTMLVVDDICYIANTGDSRAIMSVSGGN
jgi:serine/threonine protein phosphatase PrpC